MKKTNLIIAVIFLSFIFGFAQGDIWQQTPSPSGAYVRSLIALANGDLLAGAEHTGVFISKDQGLTWVPTGGDWYDNAPTGFAAADNGDIITATWSGLFKSSDQGQTWTAINPTQLASVWFFCVMKASNGALYAGSWGDGVFMSSDHGATWQQSNNGLTDLAIQKLIQHPSGDLFVGCRDSGMYRSSDGGATWSAKNNGLDVREIRTLARTSDGILYAGGYGVGLYKSSDKGESWTRVAPQTIPYSIDAVHVHDDSTLFISGSSSFGVMKSSDKGSTWGEKSNGLWDRDITCFLSGANNTLFAGCRDMGMYKSADLGESWQWCGKGLAYPRTQKVVGKAQNGYLFLCSTNIAVARSKDGGAGWEYCHNGIFANYVPDLLVSPEGKLFCISYGHGIYRSLDDGDSWVKAADGIRDPYLKCLFFNHKTNEVLAGSSYGHVYRSANYGEQWVKSDSGLANGTVHQFAVNSQGHLFTATGKGLYRSTDGGKYWQIIDTIIGDGEPRKVIVTHDDFIYVGKTGDGLYRSKDQGASWELLLTNQLFSTQSGLLVDDNGALYISSHYNGVYRSVDKGDNWTEYNSGLPTTKIEFISLDHKNYLHAGIDHRGLFRTRDKVTSTAHGQVAVPRNLKLEQNYPNPFNPQTRIQFSLRQAGMIEFAVFNLHGRQMYRTEKFYQQGSHCFSLEASALATGRYYVQLKAGTETARMSITKLK